MKLATFLKQLDHAEIQALELRLGRHRHYLRRISSGDRMPSHIVALQIERITDGAVPRWELRPDIWKKPAKLKANGSTHNAKRAR